jgi:hypothetical protein
MILRKISCTRCQHYSACPHKTRMLVNYCGSQHQALQEQIKLAAEECKNRRGQLFRRSSFRAKPRAGIYPDLRVSPIA